MSALMHLQTPLVCICSSSPLPVLSVLGRSCSCCDCSGKQFIHSLPITWATSLELLCPEGKTPSEEISIFCKQAKRYPESFSLECLLHLPFMEDFKYLSPDFAGPDSWPGSTQVWTQGPPPGGPGFPKTKGWETFASMPDSTSPPVLMGKVNINQECTSSSRVSHG